MQHQRAPATVQQPMSEVSFESFTAFLREFLGLSGRVTTELSTRFEEDLRVTGDDGLDLLVATEQTFNVQLSSTEDGYRKTFGLAADEYLFHSEGTSLLGFFIGRKEKVVQFTVGQLYGAVIAASQTTYDKVEPDSSVDGR